VLPRSAKAALVPWFAHVPLRTGFRGEWRYGLLNDIRVQISALDQTVKRFVALGRDRDEPAGPLPTDLFPRLTVDAANVERLRTEHALERGAPLVALMPGAEYGPAKRWSAQRYGALARRLATAGSSIVVLGSAKERPLGDEITAVAGEMCVRNLCGRTTLIDVIDLVAAADAAVSNDSGLLHVAAATGTPVVAIYGSSSPTFTPPLTDSAAVVYLRLDCSPCFARECPLGHLRCLTDISVEHVLAQVAALRRVSAPSAPSRADA
jgi:lipopolysaccharide heptosyltransferase II